MPYRVLGILLILGAVLGLAPSYGQQADSGGGVLVLEVQGAIGPATSDYLARGLETAAEQGARLVVIRMDTPGGLDSAMRQIIKRILNSPVPVATYVSPGGARAASAGTYILYASHVAAMSPATNLGAATPVQIGGAPSPTPPDPGRPEGKDPGEANDPGKDPSTDRGKDGEGEAAAPGGDAMKRKIVNDAVAYIRGLAELRGRNAEWAEKAVREAASLTAERALEENVIDLVAPDLSSLLEGIDGRKVTVLGSERALSTKGATIEVRKPDWRTRLLAVITDPNVAYVLMLLGIYGLIFEFANPGMVVPGVVGAICLVLALFAFQVLPVNYAGLALMLLGIAFMVAEAFAPSFGILGIGGVVAFVAGSIILMDTDDAAYGISYPLIFGVALVSAGFFMGVIGMAIKSRMRPVVSGREEVTGSVAEAVDDIPADGRGRVRLRGELWQADADVAIARGEEVRVTGLKGLILEVKPVEEKGR